MKHTLPAVNQSIPIHPVESLIVSGYFHSHTGHGSQAESVCMSRMFNCLMIDWLSLILGFIASWNFALIPVIRTMYPL